MEMIPTNIDTTAVASGNNCAAIVSPTDNNSQQYYLSTSLVAESILDDDDDVHEDDDRSDFLEYILGSLGIDIMCGVGDTINDDFSIGGTNHKNSNQMIAQNQNQNRLIMPRPTNGSTDTNTSDGDGNNSNRYNNFCGVEYYKFPKIHTTVDDIFANKSVSPLLLLPSASSSSDNDNDSDKETKQQQRKHGISNQTRFQQYLVQQRRHHRLDPFIGEHNDLILCGDANIDFEFDFDERTTPPALIEDEDVDNDNFVESNNDLSTNMLLSPPKFDIDDSLSSSSSNSSSDTISAHDYPPLVNNNDVVNHPILSKSGNTTMIKRVRFQTGF